MTVAATSKYSSAERRWAGVGPYYAMFPASFAEAVIGKYTDRGDLVLDPFSGRGTAVFAAAMTGRAGVGIEINPVGYVYTRAKLKPALRESVEERILQISANAWRYRKAADDLPKFFHRCYCRNVRSFLLTARNWLDWRNSAVDCTLMALLLVHLHGKRTDSLSNQMRQTKSLSPQYSIRWWKENGMTPPKIDPAEFMTKKLDWRYSKGRPKLHDSRVFLGDSVSRLPFLERTLDSMGGQKVSLLLTSPPYCGVTNYHYDQWLRLWLLGGPEAPMPMAGANKGKFFDQKKYASLLSSVFEACSPLMNKNAVVYVRTDSREVTLNATLAALQAAFPSKKIEKRNQPFMNPTQTALFTDDWSDDGEVDIIMQ